MPKHPKKATKKLSKTSKVSTSKKGRKTSAKKKSLPAEVVKTPAAVVPITIKEETVKREKKPSQASIEKMYFTKDTEDAIIRFNRETDFDIRNKIYEEHIQRSFEKLVENIFNTFKFSYFEVGPAEVQKETLSHLLANIHKFEEGKGKAFSYFSIVAKNYLIFHNNSNYKRFNQHVDITEESGEHMVKLQTVDSHLQKQTTEFIKMMVDYWDKNIKNVFPKNKDLKIAEAVVELFRNSDRLEFFNKKVLYLYIREISECKTQQITKIINKMKEHHLRLGRYYLENGTTEPEYLHD